MKTYLNPEEAQFAMLKEYADDVPIKMLNLLKFREDVDGKSGEAAYEDYLKAAEPFLAGSEAKLLFMGKAELSIIGPVLKEWDKVLIVEYPTKKHFFKMATAEGYPSHLRDRALEDSRLILCS